VTAVTAPEPPVGALLRGDGGLRRFRYYRLRAEPLVEVLAWVRSYERFWTDRLATLGRVLDAEGRVR